MWEQENKVLGVIGGMGPLATQLFYRQVIDLTVAGSDQEHLNMMLLNHATMPDRTAAILTGNTEELFQKLFADAKKLEELGAAAIAIPCNTSHYFVDRMQKNLSIPIIHMIREAVKVVAGQNLITVGILATSGTIQSGLYQEACRVAGLKPVVPSEESQKLVMKIIYDGVKKGGVIDYNDFIRVEGELAYKGCQKAILACTELSCFKEMFHLPDYYVDAMEVLALRSIEACGKTARKQRD